MPTPKPHRFDHQWVACLDCGTKRHKIFETGDWVCNPTRWRLEQANRSLAGALNDPPPYAGEPPTPKIERAPTGASLDAHDTITTTDLQRAQAAFATPTAASAPVSIAPSPWLPQDHTDPIPPRDLDKPVSD